MAASPVVTEKIQELRIELLGLGVEFINRRVDLDDAQAAEVYLCQLEILRDLVRDPEVLDPILLDMYGAPDWIKGWSDEFLRWGVELRMTPNIKNGALVHLMLELVKRFSEEKLLKMS